MNTLLLKRKDSREPTLINLANFVEDEMTPVNNPLHSREAVSQYPDKGPMREGQRGDTRKFHTWPPRHTIHQKVHKREIK